MCGIAGIFMKNGEAVDRSALAAMSRALRHRGPDGEGECHLGPVGVASRRLAIIDVDHGKQPLYGSDGLMLVGNGEIYNFVELRAGENVPFLHGSNSDFEPLLPLMGPDGLAAVRRLRGMYAFALHRPRTNDVLLGRDPFGIKPLYVLNRPDMLAFASEPQAFFAAGLATPIVDPRKNLELLHRWYTLGRDTIFRGIQRILPGETIRIVDGQVVERDHYDPLSVPPPAKIDDEEAALAAFDRVFEDSVRIHQRSDVPYGMFLSGGLDSTALLTMMARLNARPIQTFTCGFSGEHVYDERPAACRVAKALGAEHVEIEFDEGDFWAMLPAVAAAFDEPTADPAILPTYKLAQIASRTVKVVLSGEGGDEMLAGYGRYRALVKPWWRVGKLPRDRGVFEGLGVLRDQCCDCMVTAPDILSNASNATGTNWSRLQEAQASDIRAWLHADLLLKLDRALMAHGVEGRTPFVDPVVAQFAFNLPDGLKIRHNKGKWLLRNWLVRHCPAAEAFARKRGFTVPVGNWIKRRGKVLGPLVAARPAVAALCHRDQVEALFRSNRKRQQKAAWTLLFFALWHRHHIEGGGPAADVATALRT